MIRVAIAGNPNSGKTTMFNSLSGRNERVGNWAGVTVSKKEAFLKCKFNKFFEDVVLVDLPGAYGMEAYTNDEIEATNFLQNEKIDVIVNVVDATILERSLFFTSQLTDTGIPVIIALNKSDITLKRKTKIDITKLSKLLNTKVVFTQATKSKGLYDVIDAILSYTEKRGHNESKQNEKRRNKKYCFTSRSKRC